MANTITHRGVLKPTLPNPVVFWGSVQEISDKVGVSYRAVLLLFSNEGRSTRKGWRAMTTEESKLHYQPPRARIPVKRELAKYQSRKYWKLTFFKDWKKGDQYPSDDPSRVFTGSPQEFCRFVNCNTGKIYRMINKHYGEPEKYPVGSINGWAIARVRKYTKDTAK